MKLDGIGINELQKLKVESSLHLKKLNDGLKTKTSSVDGVFHSVNLSIEQNLKRFLGVVDEKIISAVKPAITEAAKEMLDGKEYEGHKSMGLNDLHKWKLDKSSPYYKQNLKQQAGFAAEILSTQKENLVSKAEGSDVRTFRADDLPKRYKHNHEYIDKVRLDADGKVVERIQTKFVGKNGKQWLSKMMSSKFEKYLDGRRVDKLECPKDYYDDVKNEIIKQKDKLGEQLKKVEQDGKRDVVNGIQKKMKKLDKIDSMVEQSNTTTKEAMYARLHPKSAVTKIFTTDTVKLSNLEGLKGGAFAAGITFTVSAVDNISSYVNGDITAEDMVKDIAKETTAAGALGYGTQFISTAISQTMRESSSQLIRTVGGSCLPVAAVSFAVESCDSIVSFAKGDIDSGVLAYDLGENAASVAGAIKGATLGASIGSAVGPVGTVAGGIVGGVVGSVVCSEIYKTAVEFGAENLDKILDKAQEFATSTVESVKEAVPEQVENVKNEFNSFAESVKIPIHV